jgi:hypothetical protein
MNFTLKKFIQKKYPYFLLAFQINETQEALLGESLLTYKLLQRYRVQNHYMLGCIAWLITLSCIM